MGSKTFSAQMKYRPVSHVLKAFDTARAHSAGAMQFTVVADPAVAHNMRQHTVLHQAYHALCTQPSKTFCQKVAEAEQNLMTQDCQTKEIVYNAHSACNTQQPPLSKLA